MGKEMKPHIRFSGFSDEWKLYKLSDITYPAGERNKDNLPYESYSITNENGFVPQIEKFENGGTMRDADKSMYYIAPPHSFAYNPARINVGSLGYQNTSKDVIVSSLYEIFKTTDDVEDRFLWHWFKTDDFKKYIYRLQEGGVRLYFYYDKLCMCSVALPDNKEQQAIGLYLDMVDNHIQLQQGKLEKMHQVRQMLLNHLFVGVNETSPEVRFTGSTREWKLLSLRDIVTPYTDYLPTPTDGYTRLGIRSHMKGTFYDYVAPSKKLGEKRLQRVKRDNLIVNIVFAWEHAVAVTTEEDEGKLVSHRFPQFSFNEGMHPMFFQYALSDPRFRHHLFLASPSGAGRNKTLRIDEMMDYKLRVPEYEEQKKIAGCLETVDQLIELYKMELEKIRNVKSACLQGMFV